MLFSSLILLIFISNTYSSHNCNEIKTEFGFLCMCNSTHCDTAPNLAYSNDSFYHVFTGRDYSGFHVKKLSLSTEPMDVALHFTLDFSQKKTSDLFGFGGSFTDSFGFVLSQLNTKTQENLLRSYFAPEGIGYSICRVPMGATDFSTHYYNYDFVQNDLLLDYFKLAPDDYLYKISVIKKVQNMSSNNIKLVVSNWGPPVWMKLNNSSESSYLKGEYYQLYADYQTRFLEEYRKEGIEFWGMTTFNEPITGASIHFSINNLIMFPEQQRKWISENLGPTLTSHGFSHLKIIVLDDQRKYMNWWMDSIAEDEIADNYTSGVGLHWYFDHHTSPEMMDKFHINHPDKFILYTESSINIVFFEDGKWMFGRGMWERGALYAHSIIESLNHWSSGWIDWNMGLDMDGGPNYLGLNCDAPIIVNAKADEFYKQPMFYVMGHFSTFAKPGACVISVEHMQLSLYGYTPSFPLPNDPIPPKVEQGVYITAVYNLDGSRVIYILNQYEGERNVSLLIKHVDKVFNITVFGLTLNSIIFWE